MAGKLEQTDQQEISIRVARMRQLQADLEEVIADVDRHRRELERIKREVAHISMQIGDRRR